MLAVGAGGAPGLTLLDTDGATVRAALVVGPDGAPGLALFDPAGKPRLAAALFHGSAPGRSTGGREPAPAIVAYDAAGVVRTTFGIRGADAGLELADGRGTARTGAARPDRTARRTSCCGTATDATGPGSPCSPTGRPPST